MKTTRYIILIILCVSTAVLHAEEYIYHVVTKGEAPVTIARKYKVSIEDIYRLNPGSEKIIWEGSTLRIPATAGEGGTNGMLPIQNDTLHIEEKLQEFITALNDISSANVGSLEEIEGVKKKLAQQQLRWNAYYQAKQALIADNEQLLNMVTEYQQRQQELSDSLDAYKADTQKVIDFNNAAAFIKAQQKEYEKMESEATKLALIEKTAPLLEKLKNKEQVMTAAIDEKYQAANAIAQQDSALAKSMEELTNVYLNIKAHSEKIQAAEYKPFIERIKDYLIGFAAVAIILMFLNVVQSKIGAVRKIKAQQKKLKEMFPQTQDPTTPTI